jgi:hypothetical protein
MALGHFPTLSLLASYSEGGDIFDERLIFF